MNHNTSHEKFATPSHRVTRHENGFQAEIILPGVPRENLAIRLENDVLELNATRAAIPDSWRLLHREDRPASYRLGLRLGREVDASRISAELKDGVLRLSLPLQPVTVPVARAIEVN